MGVEDVTFFDAVVVGSGPGGATVSRGLAEHGWRVLILEMGAHHRVTGGMGQTIRELWMPQRSLFVTTGMLAVMRGVTVGGSSIYSFGTALEPPWELFRPYGIDIRDDVGDAKRELSVAPLPTSQFGPAALRIMESAVGLGYDWAPLPKLLDQTRLGGRVMGSYGAPSYEAKWTARRFVDDAVAYGATLVTRSRALRVLVQDGTAIGVEYLYRGQRRTALASVVVVAAGGIGSPVILRASGIGDAGRSFFCDPLVAVTGSLPDVGRGPELPMVGGAVFDEEGYLLTDLSVPRWVHTLAYTQVGRLDQVRRYGNAAAIMVKVRDEVQGEITRRGGIRKRLTDADHRKLDRGAERARAILEHAGAQHIARSFPFASHPGGTVPLGRLVNADLQTQIRGLYVCDASVIADPWGRPPTLTLVSLGRRLARHLAGARVAIPGQRDRHARPLTRPT